MGLAQFMPATWRDMEKRFGISASPHDDVAIEWGARYMAIRMNAWKSNRPIHERWRLGLVSYNAGMGNILRAQEKCDNALLWKDIEPCLVMVTGEANSHETRTYVERIERYWSGFSGGRLDAMPRAMRSTPSVSILDQIRVKFDTRRFFSGSAWCSYWKPWPDEARNTWVSAHHCHFSMLDRAPDFVLSKIVYVEPYNLDGVIYGTRRAKTRPRAPRIGESVYLVGYPAGSKEPTLRKGKVYIKRKVLSGPSQYAHADTIVAIPVTPGSDDVTQEPVVGGMSGGAVVSATLEPLAIMVAQNSPADLTGDGVPDNSADVVPLRDVWLLEKSEIMK